jgi:hypothetical protein
MLKVFSYTAVGGVGGVGSVGSVELIDVFIQ